MGMDTLQHDFSSMQTLFRLLIFLELDLFLSRFITNLIDRFINMFVDGFIDSFNDRFIERFVIFSWTSQFFLHFGNVSIVPEILWHKTESGIWSWYSRKEPPIVSEEVIQNEHLQSSNTACGSPHRPSHRWSNASKHQPRKREDKHFDFLPNVLKVAPDRACTHRFVLSRSYPASHA